MSIYETKPWTKSYAEWTPATLEYGDTTLVDVYNDNLKKNAHKPATWFFGRSQSYAALDQQVRAAAAGLKAFGVRPGDRVAIVLPNCPQHLAAFYAVVLLGATVVEHNPRFTEHELKRLFQDHGARVAIVWDNAVPTVDALRKDCNLETIISVNMIEAMPPLKQFALKLPIPSIREKRNQLSGPAENAIEWKTLLSTAIGGRPEDLKFPDHVSKDDVAIILYTSGTTGRPKGVPLTHANIYSNCKMGEVWAPEFGENDESLLGALPMFHIFGLTLTVALGVHVGGEIILMPAPQIPLIMDVMKKHTPTWIPAVPTLFSKILEEAEGQDIEIKGVRNSFSGAAPLPLDIIDEWEKLTGGQLVEGYGLSETSPILAANPMNGNRRPGYIGLPMPDTEMRIANPENLDEDMPIGQEGELLCRGPQVLKGYLDNPEADEAGFHNGWFRTGDVALMEEDGFFKVIARTKELIITGGFNVYPAEVEEVISKHPDVVETAVVGRPRPDGSEDPVACVILRDGAALDPEGLKRFANERLTNYKVPRTFYHFEELKADQLGKVRRREVKEDLLKLLEAES